jgi:hypothetical protein
VTTGTADRAGGIHPKTAIEIQMPRRREGEAKAFMGRREERIKKEK